MQNKIRYWLLKVVSPKEAKILQLVSTSQLQRRKNQFCRASFGDSVPSMDDTAEFNNNNK